MCNKLHEDSIPIKEEGFGYKIFEIGEWEKNYDDFYGINCAIPYDKEKDGSIVWITGKVGAFYSSSEENYGFCFFLYKTEAKRAKNLWGNMFPNTKTVIKKIKYKKGLGSHKEGNFIAGRSFAVALCKEFKILDDKI